MDVAVYKFSAAGTLEFIAYLEGEVNESPGFFDATHDGKVAIAGTTDSTGFPVTAGAFQSSYGGPPAALADTALVQDGDFFAAVLDSATGRLESPPPFRRSQSR